MQTPQTSNPEIQTPEVKKGSATKPTKNTPPPKNADATKNAGTTKNASQEEERPQAEPTEEQNLSLVERLNNGRTAVQSAQARQVTEFADAITNNMIDLAGPTIALQMIEKIPEAIEKGGDYLKAFLHSIPTTGMPVETVFGDTSSLTMEDPFFATLQLMEVPLTEEISPIEEEISPIQEILLLVGATPIPTATTDQIPLTART